MGQLFSSEEELSQAKDAIGSVLYDAMLEGGAVPDLGVVHPVLLVNHDEGFATQASLQEQLKQLQGDIGSRAPTYLRDLIGRLSAFSDEPRLAGLVGLVVTMVMDMAYTSSKQPSGVKGRSAGSSSSQQRVWELQEVMEEYLKRCRISLSDKNKLIQDSVRLEAQLSLVLTQLKTCLLGGDCDSRCLRHWASGAAFHTQMLVHLAVLEGKAEPLSARAALEQYKEDLAQILPAYRRYKLNTISVVKCRGGLLEGCDASGEVSEDGNMTGITVTDRETGQSVTIPLSSMETETGRRRRVCEPDDASKTVPSSLNMDLITSDQYAQAYLDRLFSNEGPVAELQNYFTKASENLNTLRCTNKKKLRNETEQSEGEDLKDQTEGTKAEQRGESRGRREETEERNQRDESLKLSIVETQPEESLGHSQDGATSE
ncbi:uncharacterized protein LOC110954153 isoform X1 [Acanthochromis polyacanthus]|uniref:uncharacterized protein LOC110954153 isoform X1 n=1 Tax=Acanthochromis polyacanthus TaxID=80966 RepID=UPI000B8F4502|nr:uncharacterized protein LOC110954153 isoform X1 [Acanthochromis polyacanthus]XP_022054200.1 uncharacterized protein LOC110954153 isoform X1 [Acanthochromis polyacanthus]XP_022054201.1 uncharacterized protein LOC110954153 isoform X1 [Acanthochromis polyacanthus]